eukprot:CAMPEP_0198296606 /NCGR_PEP_ID=MMETSP1449-20131203/33249_1 /TAXON_ID=420275 /ORGANISM="Attheya septentrionalis, Strain CCMP2084" /LENGTH=689 /DNA_ID=CAMNT_0043997271 /DNA_START=113 /DNA_END=2182 /DNA_ORIENTATION=-
MSTCPQCSRPATGLMMLPMSFREIDEARKTAAALADSTKNRGRKRKNSYVSKSDSSEKKKNKTKDQSNDTNEKVQESADLRTGRWTTEEMAICDQLVGKFKDGELPLSEGIKLNDFLANMLKSKQSRLTKKMKNAKLSAKTFKINAGYIVDSNQAREFSDLEESFFLSIQCHLERAEIRFHMQREWREHFSSYCVSIEQPLDADAWLSSVEEMDRRASIAKDAARMSRRKMLMGYALSKDSQNSDAGVFIEKTEAEKMAEAAQQMAFPTEPMSSTDIIAVSRDPHQIQTENEEILNFLADRSFLNEDPVYDSESNGKVSLLHSAPFVAQIMSYVQRHSVPFEHMDVWVPSFVPDNGSPNEPPSTSENTTCRLCFAGSHTSENQVPANGKGSFPIDADVKFNLVAFGDYSQKFSFRVGCGLPGRVYQSGLPTWEQSVQNAPHNHFERCGGASQWGIKTVVGIPVPSPKVGRVVVVLYSCHDRKQDQDLVSKLIDEFTRLTPSPKWKLVVDIGEPVPLQSSAGGHGGNSMAFWGDTRDQMDCINQVVCLLGEHMPSDPTSPLASYLPGFMSLRLALLTSHKTLQEKEIIRTMLGSFVSYTAGGRNRSDIAIMLARDYMFLSSQKQQMPQSTPLSSSSLLTSSTNELASDPSLGVSFYGIHGTDNMPFQDSPALTPIPAPANMVDTLSIVSN